MTSTCFAPIRSHGYRAINYINKDSTVYMISKNKNELSFAKYSSDNVMRCIITEAHYVWFRNGNRDNLSYYVYRCWKKLKEREWRRLTNLETGYCFTDPLKHFCHCFSSKEKEELKIIFTKFIKLGIAYFADIELVSNI